MTRYTKFKAAVGRVRKVLAAAAALAIVALLNKAGISLVSEDVQDIIDFLFVSGAVYLAPANVKPVVEDVLEDSE